MKPTRTQKFIWSEANGPMMTAKKIFEGKQKLEERWSVSFQKELWYRVDGEVIT